MEIEEFRASVDAWLQQNSSALTPDSGAVETLDDQMAQLAKVKRLTYEAGWMRWGWPTRVGGLGGSTLLRAYLGEALTSRDLVEPGIYSMTEVLAPTMIDYAAPELAAEMVPRLLRGEETWCQGFSEPGTGSNLAALSCRATRSGDVWRVTGQKVWTSLAQYADRCVLLTRTGAPESAHKGITALFVDMDSPGIVVRPIETMHGLPEFSEVFFDDVVVPVDRTLGEEGQGWSVAMDLLPVRAEHGAVASRRLPAPAVAEPPQRRAAGHARPRRTWARSPSSSTPCGPAPGPRSTGWPRASTSVPRPPSTRCSWPRAEQAVFDLVADGLGPDVAAGDDPAGRRWRREFLYSRAATIYGGTAEIQRNIIARRLLDLGSDR